MLSISKKTFIKYSQNLMELHTYFGPHIINVTANICSLYSLLFIRFVVLNDSVFVGDTSILMC